jgi:hypothetical protein
MQDPDRGTGIHLKTRDVLNAAFIEHGSELMQPRNAVVVCQRGPLDSHCGNRVSDIGGRVVAIAQRRMTVQVDPDSFDHMILETG